LYLKHSLTLKETVLVAAIITSTPFVDLCTYFLLYS